jgi:hypothetical protein
VKAFFREIGWAAENDQKAVNYRPHRSLIICQPIGTVSIEGALDQPNMRSEFMQLLNS